MKCWTVIHYIVFLSWTTCLRVTASSYIVESPSGRFEGIELTAINGQKYIGFRGIPYAKPPLGRLRFAKPVPYPKIEGTFNATKEMVWCPQHPPPPNKKMQEDCLMLHISIPKSLVAPDAKKKVIIFSHGGAFMWGSAYICDMGTLVTEQEIIMVAMNYRLGILGFLSTENEASPGNYGLWDQVLAIQWVKENIASFGGDPDDITIAGESAGGSSVSLLALSPVTKGLFQKVMAISGSATSFYGNTLNPQFSAMEFATSANCWSDDLDKTIGLKDSKAIVDCLRQRPIEDFNTYFAYNFPTPQFVPSTDGELIPRMPFQLLMDTAYLESIGFYRRTYLLSLNNGERSIIDKMKAYWEHSTVTRNLPNQPESWELLDTVNMSRKFAIHMRLGVSPPHGLTYKISDWYSRRFGHSAYVEFMSDMWFLIPTFDYIDAVAKDPEGKVYFVYLNHYPAFMKGDQIGIAHGLEMAYWLDLELKHLEEDLHLDPNTDMDSEDLQIKETCTSIIAYFVKIGDPSQAINEKMSSEWPQYDLEDSNYLNLGLQLSIRRHLEEDKRDLWMKTAPVWASQHENHPSHTEL